MAGINRIEGPRQAGGTPDTPRFPRTVDHLRRAIYDAGRAGNSHGLVAATEEYLGEVAHISIEVPGPTSEGLRAIEIATQQEWDNVHLLYIPGHNLYGTYPLAFSHRLSEQGGTQILGKDGLTSSPGWRIIDTSDVLQIQVYAAAPDSPQIDVVDYVGDEKFMGPILAELREAGKLPKPAEVGLEDWIEMTSRQGLIPQEIIGTVGPQVDEILQLSTPTLGLPSVREAMFTSALYGVPLTLNEWQSGQMYTDKNHYAKEQVLHPAGLEHSHSAMGGDNIYYTVRAVSRKHHGATGFRLFGRL